VTESAEVVFSAVGQEVLACVIWTGDKDWEAGDYNPLTNTMFSPLRNTCARTLSTDTIDDTRERALTAGGQAPLAIYGLAARDWLATHGERV
jgi:hypothetical protein